MESLIWLSLYDNLVAPTKDSTANSPLLIFDEILSEKKFNMEIMHFLSSSPSTTNTSIALDKLSEVSTPRSCRISAMERAGRALFLVTKILFSTLILSTNNGQCDDIDVHYATRPILKESEFEDLIDPGLYIDPVRNKYGVELNNAAFLKGKKKWSDRVKACFDSQGRGFDKDVLRCIKSLITDKVKTDPSSAMTRDMDQIIASLVLSLESKLRLQGKKSK